MYTKDWWLLLSGKKFQSKIRECKKNVTLQTEEKGKKYRHRQRKVAKCKTYKHTDRGKLQKSVTLQTEIELLELF